MNKLLLLAFVLFTNFIYGQQNISGTIIDGLSKETLIGANVIVKNTQNGTSTNFNGVYQLNVPALPIKLTITYLGYKTIDVEIKTKNPPSNNKNRHLIRLKH